MTHQLSNLGSTSTYMRWIGRCSTWSTRDCAQYLWTTAGHEAWQKYWCHKRMKCSCTWNTLQHHCPELYCKGTCQSLCWCQSDWIMLIIIVLFCGDGLSVYSVSFFHDHFCQKDFYSHQYAPIGHLIIILSGYIQSSRTEELALSSRSRLLRMRRYLSCKVCNWGKCAACRNCSGPMLTLP